MKSSAFGISEEISGESTGTLVLLQSSENHYTISIGGNPFIKIQTIEGYSTVIVEELFKPYKYQADRITVLKILALRLLTLYKEDSKFPVYGVLLGYLKVIDREPLVGMDEVSITDCIDYGTSTVIWESSGIQVEPRFRETENLRIRVFTYDSLNGSRVPDIELEFSIFSLKEVEEGIIVTLDGNQFLIPESNYWGIRPVIEMLSEIASNLSSSFEMA